MMQIIFLKNAADTERCAAMLAKKITPPATIFLEGELGSGKTTFAKGFLAGLGYHGNVKSPTYTLLETYEINGILVLHADLYRIADPNELVAMGFRDYFHSNTIALIEWASRALDMLPKQHTQCRLTIPQNGVGRVLEMG